MIGSTGSASAQTVGEVDGSQCNPTELAIIGLSQGLAAPTACDLFNDDAASELDAYTASVSMAASQNGYLTTRNNLEQDARGLMWMEGKSAAIEALNNGANESEMNTAFDEAVNNYTSNLIENDMRQMSQQQAQAAYLAKQAGATNTSNGYVISAIPATGEETFELPDGRIVTIKTHMEWVEIDSTQALYESMVFHNRQLDNDHPDVPNSEGVQKINDSAPFSSYDKYDTNRLKATHPSSPDSANAMDLSDNQTVEAVDIVGYNQQITDWVVASYNVKQNGDEWINNSYQRFEAGEIDAVDFWDPVTLANEASTSYGSTGFYSFANAELAALGLAGDANVSHEVQTNVTVSRYNGPTNTTDASYNTTTYPNATIEGTVFLTGDGDMSLETGKTYDPANLSGTPVMTVANATAGDGTEITGLGNYTDLKEPFTIESAIDTQSGDPVNVTTAEDENYETTNNTEFIRQIERLKAQRDAYQAMLSASGGSGDDSEPTDSRSSIPPESLILILAGAGVIGLLLRGRGDRR
ncbi:hypothetical protein EGH22_10645 [Halomicroarcula sp. F28]|nr:hypothetical protein [Halomicroarcula salinisoli]